MKKILLVVLTFLICSCAEAQTTFQKTIGYNAFANEAGNSITATSDGGTATVGYAFTLTGDEVFVVKLDGSGNVQWTKTIGGSGDEAGNSIVQTSDGGYVIAGYTNSYGSGGSDVFVVKLDGSGNIQWAKTIGGSNNEVGYSIVHASDGGYAITGRIVSGSPSASRIYVVKLDNSGNLLWTKIISTSGGAIGYSIIQASDGGYAVAGLTGGTTTNYVYVLKLDGSGNIQWTAAVGDTSDDWGTAIIQTSDGGYAVCGRTGIILSASGFDVYVVKLNSAGTLQWTRTIYGTSTSEEGGYGIVQNPDNSLTVCGYSYALAGSGFMDFYLVKLSATGNLIWTRSIGTAIYNDYGYSIARTTDGGYALCGYVEYFDFSTDMLIIKTDANGNSCTNGIIGTTATYGAAATVINTATSGGVITDVVPVEGSGGIDSMLCSSFPTEVDDRFDTSIFNLSPNPATNELTVQSRALGTKFKVESIEIYDVLGEKVFSQTTTGNQQTINVAKLTPGIYFVKVRSEKEERVGKFVKQ